MGVVPLGRDEEEEDNHDGQERVDKSEDDWTRCRAFSRLLSYQTGRKHTNELQQLRPNYYCLISPPLFAGYKLMNHQKRKDMEKSGDDEVNNLAERGHRKLVIEAVALLSGVLISIEIPNCRNGSVKSTTSSLRAVTVIGATAMCASWRVILIP